MTLPSTLVAMLSEALFSSWSIVLYCLMYSVYNDSVIPWECFGRFTTLLFYYNLSSSDSSHTTSVYSTISMYHHYDFNHCNQLMNDLLKYQCGITFSKCLYFKFQFLFIIGSNLAAIIIFIKQTSCRWSSEVTVVRLIINRRVK